MPESVFEFTITAIDQASQVVQQTEQALSSLKTTTETTSGSVTGLSGIMTKLGTNVAAAGNEKRLI